MPTIDLVGERTNFHVRPGRAFKVPNPLNQGDAIDITLNGAALFGQSSETVSSASWSADSGITVSNAAVLTPNVSATLTAAATAIGEVKVECQITGSGNTIRTVLLLVEIVNLR